MKVLVVGSGGREHAIAWKLSQEGITIATAGCNAGLKEIAGASCHEAKATDIESIVKIAREEKVDLVVVGPEAPLAEGLADRLRYERIKVFGPSKEAARIESDKSFAKQLMRKHSIPTARFEIFDDPSKAIEHIEKNYSDKPVVVKASGLAAGKGAFVCKDHQEAIEAVEKMMIQKMFGEAGEKVVIEEYLEGRELSFFAIVSGDTYISLPAARDYKRLLDNDQGPNTGGMGCYAPVPWATDELIEAIKTRIIGPTINALIKEGIPYFGVLYAGLMITPEGPKVLEFNVRFGDPEAEVLMPVLNEAASSSEKPALSEIFMKVAEEEPLKHTEIKAESYAVDVVMASEGYPYSPKKGALIEGIDRARKIGTLVFVAGAKTDEESRWITSGGRVLNIVGTGSTPAEARAKSYSGVEEIRFEGAQYRKDIAAELIA